MKLLKCWLLCSISFDCSQNYKMLYVLQGVVADTSPQTVPPSSQESSGQQQQMAVETSSEHASAYSYQQTK